MFEVTEQVPGIRISFPVLFNWIRNPVSLFLVKMTPKAVTSWLRFLLLFYKTNKSLSFFLQNCVLFMFTFIMN